MEHRRWLFVLAVPVAALASASVVIGMNPGSMHRARANMPNAGVKFTLHVGSCANPHPAQPPVNPKV